MRGVRGRVAAQPAPLAIMTLDGRSIVVGMTGGIGEVFEAAAFVETADGTWSSQPILVEIVPAEARWPEPPPLVSATPGDSAAPPPTRGAIVTDQAGRYVINATSGEGSTGFDVWLNAERTIRHIGFSQVSLNRHLGLGTNGHDRGRRRVARAAGHGELRRTSEDCRRD